MFFIRGGLRITPLLLDKYYMKKDWKQIWEEAEKASRQYGSLEAKGYIALGFVAIFLMVFVIL